MDLHDNATTGETYYRWVKCIACAGTGFPPRVYRAVGYRSCPHCGGIGKVEYHRGAKGVWTRKAPDLPELIAQPVEGGRATDFLLSRVLPLLFVLAFIAWAIVRRFP